MVEFINFLTFIWLTLCLIYVLANFFAGAKNTIYFVYLVFYVFFALPIGGDWIFGKAQYDYEIGFKFATEDELTAIIYCAYITCIPILWFLFGKTKHGNNELKVAVEDQAATLFKIIEIICYCALVSPLIVTLLSPNPELYLEYAAVIQDLTYNQNAMEYHGIVSMTSTMSIFAAGTLILVRDKMKTSKLVLIFPWVAIALWVNGKRALVVMAIFIILFSLWQKKYLNGWKFPAIVAVSVMFIAVFSSSYQSNIRYDDLKINSSSEVYKNVRVDFSRDDRVKMTIYSELYPDRMKILDYRGQSIVFDLTMFIPRSIWEEKPWPYAVYFTSAMLMMPTQYIGWGMTTSWLEEAIANFGWFGFLIGPLVINYICRIGDRQELALLKVFTTIVASLLLILQLAAFYPLFFIWLLLILKVRKMRNKGKSKLV
ncbi:O-antigen polysaccharide polymerase Wzy [Bacillus cereus]|uniref:Oligosaccharide repeat unit polymerase n=2 Tax=Bacillaceae TaxID=186817 RepID=B7HFG6_BACC4|nr:MULTISPECIES: O-antigen polysaccharide polymerase Wzy [Bacillus cereus group]ACK61283.1 hypothetical protein BCB4264_A5391 [Bacillus cereus B4264]MCB5897707.1 O-antigen polysaccharide polymerase Wzy [Bacillus cereus]MDZ4630844.1 O-antigen polysaccharide polymerase Wzy [Bacillus cereus]MEB2586349.1 O-antigen polysaccharide polymerase Wzy [Bacillus cereus]MEB2614584.1 O-antigen polysaccharide polymerase Wzy [Bacillus cereus]